MINTLILGKYRRKEGDFSGRSMIAPTISNKTETEKEFFDSLRGGFSTLPYDLKNTDQPSGRKSSPRSEIIIS